MWDGYGVVAYPRCTGRRGLPRLVRTPAPGIDGAEALARSLILGGAFRRAEVDLWERGQIVKANVLVRERA